MNYSLRSLEVPPAGRPEQRVGPVPVDGGRGVPAALREARERLAVAVPKEAPGARPERGGVRRLSVLWAAGPALRSRRAATGIRSKLIAKKQTTNDVNR